MEKLFDDASKLISEFPEIGTEIDIPGLRVKVMKSYKLLYLNLDNTIQIIRVWDARQDPEKLKSP